jgi:hypothetical protein
MSSKVKKCNAFIKPLPSRESATEEYSNNAFENGQKFSSVDFKMEPYFNQSHVSVEFAEDLSIQQVAEEINQLATPQIIVWYIGCYGLRKNGVEFYKDFLISPVLKQNLQAAFWLVDLTGWNAFKNPQGSIHSVNSCCDRIDGFSDARIKCIRSAKIFRNMQNLEEDLIGHFKKALQNDFIHELSKGFPNVNIRVREIFSDSCPVMTNWYDHDVSKSYSVFQYLEGCLLIDEIFMHQVSNKLSNDFQIVFALPNDELNYYRDRPGSFQKDVDFLISKRCKALNIDNVNLQIKFFAFKYGSQPQHRPYNAPGIVLKKNDLSYGDIVGNNEQIEKLAIGK